ncbi:lamin tail domain-containing protein [Algoriphagus sp. AK58]|uniref:lamin tail domain-containing protein n=1 Tax=Algoriphagus sp. AK58 TaxID=1406877 RepID=UPI00164F66E3|nr:lamin tail domain-containing protein [Algoriphagus sp. AK58]MBC6367628.1 hypothetical protein [Algoriphagus sp. AK58]
MNHLFRSIVFWLIVGFGFTLSQELFGQRQNFESQFSIASFPQEFLPGWYGNEVRSTASRIFQSPNLGRGNSRALAVQPISTFNGEIWVRLKPAEFENPKVSFWARSLQNGTGNRPALVYFSWGESLNGGFTNRALLGGENEFGNENQEYRRFVLELPDELTDSNEVFLKIEILYGPGSGSGARWLLDDFELGNFVQDVISPKVATLKGYAKNELFLGFDEPIDPVFSLFPIAYRLEGVEPERIKALNDSTVIIGFQENLEEGRSYRLSINQIPDLEGNFLRDTVVTFRFSDPTAFGYKSLVINELMPAPRVDQDLPNVEYVELFNPTEKEFRLQGVRFSNSRSSTALSEYWIQPGEYLLLAPSNQANQLQEFGSVIPVSPWPSMLNSGDVMGLTSSLGEPIDQLSFVTTSWRGSEFANGGYSLEVINPFFLCDNSEFLRPSTDPSRGTPGKQNSLFSIETSDGELKIETAYFLGPDHIELVFNQPFVPKIKSDQISLSPELRADSVWISSAGRALHIKLVQPAIPSLKYELHISDLVTCAGILLDGGLSVTLVLAEEADKGDLIINEVLFDARVGDPKFVEIHNTTERYLSLEFWALANLNDSGLPNQIRVFGTKGSMLGPGGFLAISTDSNRLRLAYPKSADGAYLQISSLPSYPISGGTVVLISTRGEVMEKFTYDPKMHHPLIRNTKGVSLERISSKTPAEVPANWQSASGNEDYATPGKRNSMAISGEFESKLIQVEPQVFDPEGSFGPTFTTIRYELDQPGWVGSFSIYSSSGLLVQTLAQNQLLGMSGLYTWSGTDSTGARVRPGYYILLVELFDLNGRTSIIKKTIVVGTKL